MSIGSFSSSPYNPKPSIQAPKPKFGAWASFKELSNNIRQVTNGTVSIFASFTSPSLEITARKGYTITAEQARQFKIGIMALVQRTGMMPEEALQLLGGTNMQIKRIVAAEVQTIDNPDNVLVTAYRGESSHRLTFPTLDQSRRPAVREVISDLQDGLPYTVLAKGSSEVQLGGGHSFYVPAQPNAPALGIVTGADFDRVIEWRKTTQTAETLASKMDRLHFNQFG